MGGITKINTSFRQFLLSLVFVSATVLCIDRSALATLSSELQQNIGWSDGQFGLINSAFTIANAPLFIPDGTADG